MKILAIDTSSLTASCAVTDDEKLLGEIYADTALLGSLYGKSDFAHSQMLMPLLDNLLSGLRLPLSEIELFAVTDGPGSFTGLRIGLSAVKGLAHAAEKPCVGVSTLEALAYNFSGTGLIVAPVLDARCSQVYTALFECKMGEAPTRLFADEAITLSELETRLKKIDSSVFLVGDGAEMCYNMLNGKVSGLQLSSPAARFTRAAAVAAAALRLYGEGNAVTPDALAPAYLRLPQAERELLARESASR